MAKNYCRSIWISDAHLCTRGCQVGYLYSFLKNVKCDYLYIVGDFIDVWQLKRRWYWPQLFNRVIRRILKIAQKGTKVVYIPGNHDEIFRDFAGFDFGQVQIQTHAIHETADGRKLLVLHGDEFDVLVKCHKWLAVLGSAAYDYLIALNRLLNLSRRKLKLPYYSLSGAIKRKVKKACQYINNFEEVAAMAAAKHKVDGVICGHIHHPIIKDLHGITYYNTGDWVENCSALVENDFGEISILRWTQDWHAEPLQELESEEEDVEVEQEVAVALANWRLANGDIQAVG